MSLQLSIEQKNIESFLRKKSDSLLVQALAGSGKTTTLIKVVLPTLLKKGVRSSDILVLMFSKPVNVEFESRLRQEKLNIRSCTFHSAGYNLLRNNFGSKTDFKKIDRLSSNLGISSDEVQKLASMCKVQGIGAIPEFPLNTDSIRKIAEYYAIEVDNHEIYQCQMLLNECLNETDTCDFDDMIWLPVIKGLFENFQYVVVDEVQDNSNLRNEFIKKCCGDCTLIAVGDRHQTIFTFAGSNHLAMDDLKNHFKAKEMPLTVTYRCAKSITNFAKRWAPDLQHREGAPEGNVVKMTFSDFYQKRIPDDSAILCRLNSPLIPLAFHLANSGRKCYIQGRAVGEEMANLAKRWKWNDVNELEPKLANFLKRAHAKLMPEKVNTYKTLVDKVDCLFSVIRHCKENRKTEREYFLDFFRNLFSDSGEGIVLGSVHSFKGKERENVYIWGWEKLMPARWASQEWEIESEKCLQFVAVTRAINNLYLVS